jgi:hypothetical protein
MTIRSRTAQLDDASGELTLALAKLELEAAHGTPNKDEQIDFVRDLSRTALRTRIHPWRVRTFQAGILGLASLAGAAFLSDQVPGGTKVGQPVLLGLALLFFLLAGTCLAVYLRQRRLERGWQRREEEAVMAGRNILDEP